MDNLDNRPVVIFNRSFWPDIEATGQFLTELCEEMAKHFSVLVIGGCSYYVKEKPFKPFRIFNKENYKNIEILRIRHTRFSKENLAGRLINWFTYSILAFIAGFKCKPRLIIACTDPPFLGIICMFFKWWYNVPFIYNCRDLYPDVATGLGKLRPGLISWIFDRLNRKALYAADIVIPLGYSMRERLKIKGVPELQMKIIPDWVDTRMIQLVSKKDNPLLAKLGVTGKFVIMYSGNIGLSQDFTSVLQAVALLKNRESWCLLFVGEGSAKKTLIQEAQSLGLDNVFFLPYQSQEMLSMSLNIADLHLVPLKKGMGGAIVPSKVYGIMAAGKTYLAITDPESEPASIQKEQGCGLWAPPGDISAIRDALQWALDHRDELEEMGKKARRAAELYYDKDIVLHEWIKLLSQNFQDSRKEL